jgi:hypothetical protein
VITALPGTTAFVTDSAGRTYALAVQAWDDEGFALVYSEHAERLMRPSEVGPPAETSGVGEAEPTREFEGGEGS